MPDATWWIIHGIQEPALLACVLLALNGSRRVGAHTPYGVFLFVVAMGFWFLLVGDLVYMARNIQGQWSGPGTLADAFSLWGWLILVCAFVLLALLFPTIGRGRSSGLVTGTFCTIGLVLVLGLSFLVLSRPGEDPSWRVRAAYLAADGIGLGALAAGGRRLTRLHQSSLGRLFLLLGSALALKTVGDLVWVYLAARGESHPWASVWYPLAGGLGVFALVRHYADVRREAFGLRRLEEPWIRIEQRILRDFVNQLRGLAGGHAARTVLLAATRAFSERGIIHQVRNDTIYATAVDEVWQQALERASGAATETLGRVAKERLDGVVIAYRRAAT